MTQQSLTPGSSFTSQQVMRAVCPRCGTTAQFRSIAVVPAGNAARNQSTFGVIQCVFCGGHVAYEAVRGDPGTFQFTFRRLYPTAEAREVEDAPPAVQAAMQEASECIEVGAATAGALVLRRAVQLIARDKGVTKGSLKSEIDKLPISEDLKQIAHATRIIANEAAHPDPFEWDQVTIEDVRQLFALGIEFVNQIYAVPARVKALSERATGLENH